jgi:hypothetical protein
MNRDPARLSIDALQSTFIEIEFPEYQREPDIWSRDQKQRLIDSILRRFDISSVYLYRREDGGLECIDGRQRLNAIMSFLHANPADVKDDGFPLKLENEISSGLLTEFDQLQNVTYDQIKDYEKHLDPSLHQSAQAALQSLLQYEISTIYLSGAKDEEEFNLQFLRLNLGALINAGEKLHAMVGAMWKVIFESEDVGKHSFFDSVHIPTRRYGKELTAAQVLLQAFALRKTNDFARGRHIDLQSFVKRYAEIGTEDQQIVDEVASTLDALQDGAEAAKDHLRNRAVTVSLVILALRKNVAAGSLPATRFWEFATTFMQMLRWQVAKMRDPNLTSDREYADLVEFQRHLTQASVEKPAVAKRDQILQSNLDQWLRDGHLVGDADYQERTGAPPGP